MRRVLLIFANPRSTSRLRLGEEDRAVSEAMQLAPLRSSFELVKLHAATIDDLHRALLQKRPEIVHISGHGTEAGLLLEHPNGDAAPVPPSALGELFSLYIPPQGELRCVLLNACYSLSQGESLGVEYTIAMEGPLHDAAAIEFVRGFYDAAAAGYSYEAAYEAGRVRVRLKAEFADWDACRLFRRGTGQPGAPSPRPSPGSRNRTKANRPSTVSWLLGVLLLLFLLAVFVGCPPLLPAYKQRFLALAAALLASLFAFSLAGDLGVSISKLGRFAARGASGLAAFLAVLGWWLSPLSPVETADRIRLRVLVLGTSGAPVEDARIWTSVGGETKKVSGGWEIDIPWSSRPAGGKTTIYASKESAFLVGSQEVSLGESLTSSATLRLAPGHFQSVRGVVVDPEGRSLGDVRVSVVGYGEDGVKTGANGEFFLPAHAADGQIVQLRAEKVGYLATTQFHPAGTFPATLSLERP